MRLIWRRAKELGSRDPEMAMRSYVPGQVLDVVGERIELTPARWQKMADFMRQWGRDVRAAVPAGGGFEYRPTRH